MLMDASSELKIDNKLYLKALKTFIWGAYQQDFAEKDITSRFFLVDQKNIKAQIKTNEIGILSGIQEVKWFLKKIGIRLIKSKKDGEKIRKGEVILEITGDSKKILGAERTLLNVLQRMSGIATKTKRMSAKLPKSIKLLATRKTLWGLLDKKAVVDGGGGTHRLNLSDAILIKDNHIALADDFCESLKAIFAKTLPSRFIEIELESEKQIKVFLEIFSKIKKIKSLPKEKIIIMLDNLIPSETKKWIPIIKKEGLKIELSGGINEENIKTYAISGIIAPSSSQMTMSAPHLDFSLEILNSKKK